MPLKLQLEVICNVFFDTFDSNNSDTHPRSQAKSILLKTSYFKFIYLVLICYGVFKINLTRELCRNQKSTHIILLSAPKGFKSYLKKI